jgi:serine/threonine protein kinase
MTELFQENFAIGDKIHDWYRITGVPNNSGGMSTVYAAENIGTNEKLAIKVPKRAPQDEQQRLPFARELAALQNLDHPNIIQLKDFGNVGDLPYLVLEWMHSDLAVKIIEYGAMKWSYFYETFGRPILEGLRFAHSRQYAHRDLKPQNILLDEFDKVKIADFGVSRSMSAPKFGPTLQNANSQPYTPHETDTGFESERRDVYSWAAIAVSCLTGKIYTDYPSLLAGLNALRDGEVPKELLLRALSIDPTCRQEAASILLIDADMFHQRQTRASGPLHTLYLFCSPRILEAMQKWIPHLTIVDVAKYITDDLNETAAALLDDLCVPPRVEIVGSTIRLIASLESRLHDKFIVETISQDTPSLAQKRREDMVQLDNVKIEITNPKDAARAVVATRSILTNIRIQEESRLRRQEEKAKFRRFDCWSAFLREKERIYKSRQVRLRASTLVNDGDRYIATIFDDFAADSIGESLVLQLSSGKTAIFEVEDVVADQLRLRLVSGIKHQIPDANVTLESNFEAERQSINRQRNALDEIRKKKCVNPNLLDLIAQPSLAESPEASGLNVSKLDVSADKLTILDSVLGVKSIHAVKGPPGTGKTTLIAELIQVYLQRYPNSRILLSSQTHVALDHILVKLQDKGLSSDIVRVTSRSMMGSDKMSSSIKEMTLERKTRTWCETAETRARDFMNTYAAKLNASTTELQVAILGEEYIKVLTAIRNLNLEIDEIRQKEMNAEVLRKEVISLGKPIDLDDILLKTTMLVDRRAYLLEERENFSRRELRLTAALTNSGDFGKEVLKSDLTAATEWVKVLTGSSHDHEKIRRLISLQLEWFDRLGDQRSLETAVLSETRVAAGTCIGLASTASVYNGEYDLCIIDEASKATATETLVPMARSRSYVLVGDPEQLPPFFESNTLYELEGFSADEATQTLLSTMLHELPSSNIGQLVQQRRMVNSIGELTSEVFYGSSLENVRSDDDRSAVISSAFEMPVTWISTSLRGFKESVRGHSFYNHKEVEVVVSLLKRLNSANKARKEHISVAVIAAYTAQVRALREAIDHVETLLSPLKIEVNTVDAFQGRDADVCIYSVTRSNDNEKLGFQRERPRLNVALSRARDALVIVGDDSFCKTVSGKNPFLEVLDHIERNPDFCIIERL